MSWCMLEVCKQNGEVVTQYAEILVQNKSLLADVAIYSLVSRIERKYCLISTSYLAGLFDIFLLLHI